MRSMNVLVLESEPGAASEAVAALASAGHQVLRCHDEGAPAFPCAALQGGCPLQTSSVDVAITMRAHPRSQPTPLEDGVICALKARVPVVVGGRTLFNPYAEFGAEQAGEDGDVVAACERAVASARPEHSQIATDALHETLRTEGYDARDAIAQVRRVAGKLLVTIAVPEATPRTARDMAAVRVTGALRKYDREARGLDVQVESLPVVA